MSDALGLPGGPALTQAEQLRVSLDLSEAQALRGIRDLRDLRTAAVNERRMRRRAEEKVRLGSVSIVRLLRMILEQRLPDAAVHSQRVADLVGRLAHSAGIPDEDVRLMQTAALICDIGLACLPDALLRRPYTKLAGLDARRFEEHSAIGEAMLGPLEEFVLLRRWIRHHHERWDGRGYPDRLAGPAIPLAARFIAVADGYLMAVEKEGGDAPGWRAWEHDRGLFDPDLMMLLDDEVNGVSAVELKATPELRRARSRTATHPRRDP